MVRPFESFRRAGIALVAIHLFVTIVHSAAHLSLGIYMAPWQNAYIFSVIVFLPILAAILLWRLRQSGFWWLLISMTGSLAFGGYYHFVAPGPDNVSELLHHAWTFPFQASAVLMAIVEGAGAAVGAAGLLANPSREP